MNLRHNVRGAARRPPVVRFRWIFIEGKKHSRKLSMTYLVQIIHSMLRPGNGKDCAPFSRLWLELVTRQKIHRPKNIMTQKGDDVKRYKFLNEIFSLSNIVLSELNIIHMHCECVCAIIINGFILLVSQHILIVEHGGHTI